MMDALVPSLMSNLGLHNSGELQNLRTGNGHGGLLVVPYNVYPVQDGGVAILAVSDQHWLALGDVLEYPDLVTDPRFVDKSSRVKNRAALDAPRGGSEITLEMIEAAPSYEARANLVRAFVRQDSARAALVVRQLMQEGAHG